MFEFIFDRDFKLQVSSVSLKEFVDIVKALRDFGYHGNLVDLDSFEK